ncbi:hypothetical protein AVEN_83777-1 [Araneus ventricosus]|uniref:Uncharacterized protein n=1 Tax=Araneus ventricosus TaxID=182803 RepID=A0A4Y2WA38_ARAVE|nr:hypothetical protein AVEN_83777-1 [Araneus ventricosus]
MATRSGYRMERYNSELVVRWQQEVAIEWKDITLAGGEMATRSASKHPHPVVPTTKTSAVRRPVLNIEDYEWRAALSRLIDPAFPGARWKIELCVHSEQEYRQ